jgi:PAS domain S-box-containing protein
VNQGSHISKIVLAICAGLLIALTLLGKDTHKERYQHWVGLLTEIHLGSIELNGELLQVRAGFVNSYHAVTTLSQSLIDLLQSANTFRESSAYIRPKNKKGGRFRQSEAPLAPDLTLLTQTMHRRMQTLKQYKIGFATLLNTQQNAARYVDQLQSIIFPDAQWRVLAGQLPALLYELKSTAEYKIDSSILANIESLNALATNHEQKRILQLLVNEINVINQISPRVTALVAQEIEQENIIHAEIKNIKSRLKNEYDVLLQTKILYTYGSLLVGCFITIYGLYQANQALRLSKLIKKQNKNLESEVDRRTKELAIREAFFRAITETANDPIVLIDSANKIKFCNTATTSLFAYKDAEVLGEAINRLLPSVSHRRQLMQSNFLETTGLTADKENLSLKISASPFDLDDGRSFVACTMHDMTQFKQLEKDLAHSQKMESVGQLATGIAHEINAPAQFVSDNLIFLKEAIENIFVLISRLNVLASTEDTKDINVITKSLSSLLEETDIDFLKAEVPTALQQSADEIKRVTTIVRAIKDYAHPGSAMEFTDINAALASTITLSRGEWEFHTELETDFADNLPLVECVVSDINQAVLHMIVNAAHAIEEKYTKAENKEGKILVKTKLLDSGVCIEITDTDNGMAESSANNIFEPLVISKVVGKEARQGLSIAHKLIVEKHQGRISVQSKPGKGTSFYIVLPCKQSGDNDGAMNLPATA